MRLVKTGLILLLCCSVSPTPLLAQEAGAMLLANGQVTVNGKAVSNSASLFPGDKVQSGAESGATISAKGASANLAAHSAVTWQPQALQFENGSMTLAAQAPWQLRIGAMTVSLGGETSKVEVTQREDVTLIKLLQGSATLNEGGQTTPLKVNFTVARPNAMASAALPAAPAAKHSSHTALILLGVGGAAAVGVGLGAHGGKSSSTQQPISPTVP